MLLQRAFGSIPGGLMRLLVLLLAAGTLLVPNLALAKRPQIGVGPYAVWRYEEIGRKGPLLQSGGEVELTILTATLWDLSESNSYTPLYMFSLKNVTAETRCVVMEFGVIGDNWTMIWGKRQLFKLKPRQSVHNAVGVAVNVNHRGSPVGYKEIEVASLELESDGSCPTLPPVDDPPL